MSTSQLFTAVQTGSLERVQRLLDTTRYAQADLREAARIACESGFTDILQYFFTTFGESVFPDDALQVAAVNGHLDTVRFLVDVGFVIISEGDDTMVYVGVNGHADVAEYLASEGIYDVEGALLEFAARGDLESVKQLAKYADPLTLDLALYEAAHNGHLHVVKYLFQKPEDAQTALVTAASRNQVDVVKYLVSQNVVSPEAVSAAMGSENIELIDYLLKIPGMNNQTLNELLLYAIREGLYAHVVTYLLQQGAQPSDSSVREAAENGNIEILQILLEHGGAMYDPTIIHAIASGHLPVVRCILNTFDVPATPDVSAAAVLAGSDMVRYLHEEQKVEFTPRDLQRFIENSADDVETLRYLVETCKVDPTAENHRAMRLAVNRNQPRLVQYLSQFSPVHQPAAYVEQQYQEQKENDFALVALMHDEYHEPLMLLWALEQNWDNLIMEMVHTLDFDFTGQELVWAIRFDNQDLMDFLLGHLNMNTAQYNDCEPLFEAIVQNNVQVVQVLCQWLKNHGHESCMRLAIESAISRGVDNDASRVAERQLVGRGALLFRPSHIRDRPREFMP